MFPLTSTYYYHLQTTHSPTSYQLSHHLRYYGWKPTRFASRSHFNENHLQFNNEVTETLEFKHQLAALCQTYCPQHIPLTYCINDHNWPDVLNKLSQKTNTAWILKPSLLNNGQHIKLFSQLEEIEQYYLNPKRVGGEYVLQQYIAPPHLLKGPKAGHKYSLRMFVVLTNYGGAYLYPKGYFNISLHPYPSNQFVDLQPHLTNEHLTDEQINVVQIPTTQYELFKPFYPQIKQISSRVINGLIKEYPQALHNKNDPKLAIFGFDFMVDQQETVWLLEANHGPCFPVDQEHPLQKTLYDGFWQGVVQDFIFPMANDKTKDCCHSFEKL